MYQCYSEKKEIHFSQGGIILQMYSFFFFSKKIFFFLQVLVGNQN